MMAAVYWAFHDWCCTQGLATGGDIMVEWGIGYLDTPRWHLGFDHTSAILRRRYGRRERTQFEFADPAFPGNLYGVLAEISASPPESDGTC